MVRSMAIFSPLYLPTSAAKSPDIVDGGIKINQTPAASPATLFRCFLSFSFSLFETSVYSRIRAVHDMSLYSALATAIAGILDGGLAQATRKVAEQIAKIAVFITCFPDIFLIIISPILIDGF